MIRRLVSFALLLCGGATARAQNPVIRIDDAGPGVGPKILAHAIEQPHTVVPPAAGKYLLTRGTDQPRTTIVLGRETIVEGRVNGDLIVVGADLFMHPGASISGRAIAIGGGVYESALATVGGGVEAFRYFTYDITPIPGGFSLRYRELYPMVEPKIMWTGVFGLSMPQYDRSNGLTLGIGPQLRPWENVVIRPRISYRSQLGKWDPTVVATYGLNRRTEINLEAGRTTETNDEWIRGPLANSAVFFWNGDDTRNYYRATGGRITVNRLWESETGRLTLYGGGRLENASSVRPALDATGGPWTVVGRDDDDRDDRLRLNPSIDKGRITSGVAGARWDWTNAKIVAHFDGDAEANTDFGQLTLDAGAHFPTFGTQTFRVESHWVTSGGSVPRQRFAYIGGPGTLPTIDLLSEGGDQLAYVDFRYEVPVDRVQLPLIGSPSITLREALGGAAIGRFPTIHQSAGFRLSAGYAYIEWMVDPSTRTGHFGFGLSSPK